MKPYFLVLFFIALLIQSCSLLRPSERLSKPEISYQSFSVKELSRSGMVILFDFEVYNPNRRDITAELIQYELFLNGESLLRDNYSREIKLPARSTSTVQIPVEMAYRQIRQTTRSVLRNDSLYYLFEANLSVDVPILGSRKVPIRAEGVVPEISLPRLRYHAYSVENVSFTGADLAITFVVENPNSFGFTLKSLQYSLEALGEEIIQTSFDDRIRLEAGAKEHITVRVRLDAETLGRSALQILTGRSGFEYAFRGRANIEADIPGLRGSVEVPLENEGNLRLGN